MKKIKVMTIFGTRPEAIKMAPIILGLNARSDQFENITVVTAQHREMLDQVLGTFKIKPDYDLDIMKQRQTLGGITINVISGLDEILEQEKPDIVLVHGDTTTTFSASISAFYHKVAIGHVEAGLRTWDKYSPYPEEMNRQLTDVLADIYFAPTDTSKSNLLLEHHSNEKIFVTGNTAIDALKQTVQGDYHHNVLDQVQAGSRVILVTMHRRENQGKPMENAFSAMKSIVDSHDNVEIIYPVHMNPVIQQMAERILGNDSRIHLIAPLDVLDFHNLAAKSYFIMTDSGGVQEEAPSLGKPVLVLRESTERPEGVDAGTLRIVGTDPEKIKMGMLDLLDNEDNYQKMAQAKNPYGDGKATERILQDIVYYFDGGERPSDFTV